MDLVSIVKCKDYDVENISSAVDKTFENLGGISKFVKKGQKVCLKANLLMKRKPKDATTTHPVLAGEVAKRFINQGAEVFIADSPGGPYSEGFLKPIYEETGMKEASERYGFKLNNDFTTSDIDNPDGLYLKKIKVINAVRNCDLIVNMPKLKSHGQMVYSGAVKNMFGIIPGMFKAEYHLRMPDYDFFADSIIDIFLSVKPQLTIMDAVVGMDGAGPASGDPKQIGLIIAGESSFSVDLTAINIINKDPLKIPVLKRAIARKLCQEKIEDEVIKGERLNVVKISDFNMPALKNIIDLRWAKKGPLRFLIDYLQPKPIFNFKECIGCGECARSCPANIIKFKNKKPYADISKCIRCFCCQELCPEKAVKIQRPLLLRLILR